MYPELKTYFEALNTEAIALARQAQLELLAAYIQKKVDAQQAVNLNFICTHNSRRSHLSQIWAQTAAAFYQVPQVHGYSGGTEATALFPKVAETLMNQGFRVEKLSAEPNPVYALKYAENALPIIGFSKVYDHPFNPQSDFVALMTCSQADEGCPFIAGADWRVPLTYDDPKAFDGTAQQTEKYLERSNQIATEMKYLFSLLKK